MQQIQKQKNTSFYPAYTTQALHTCLFSVFKIFRMADPALYKANMGHCQRLNVAAKVKVEYIFSLILNMITKGEQHKDREKIRYQAFLGSKSSGGSCELPKNSFT